MIKDFRYGGIGRLRSGEQLKEFEHKFSGHYVNDSMERLGGKFIKISSSVNDSLLNSNSFCISGNGCLWNDFYLEDNLFAQGDEVYISNIPERIENDRILCKLIQEQQKGNFPIIYYVGKTHCKMKLNVGDTCYKCKIKLDRISLKTVESCIDYLNEIESSKYTMPSFKFRKTKITDKLKLKDKDNKSYTVNLDSLKIPVNNIDILYASCGAIEQLDMSVYHLLDREAYLFMHRKDDEFIYFIVNEIEYINLYNNIKLFNEYSENSCYDVLYDKLTLISIDNGTTIDDLYNNEISYIDESYEGYSKQEILSNLKGKKLIVKGSVLINGVDYCMFRNVKGLIKAKAIFRCFSETMSVREITRTLLNKEDNNLYIIQMSNFDVNHYVDFVGIKHCKRIVLKGSNFTAFGSVCNIDCDEGNISIPYEVIESVKEIKQAELESVCNGEIEVKLDKNVPVIANSNTMFKLVEINERFGLGVVEFVNSNLETISFKIGLEWIKEIVSRVEKFKIININEIDVYNEIAYTSIWSALESGVI